MIDFVKRIPRGRGSYGAMLPMQKQGEQCLTGVTCHLHFLDPTEETALDISLGIVPLSTLSDS